MKSDEMAKSLMAQFASQTMGIILQSKQEMTEKEAEYLDDLNWHRMRIEDLEEDQFALEAELENEKSEKAELLNRLKKVAKERDQFRQWCSRSQEKVRDLEVELESIKKSDVATSD
jgi:chromosome segregation ATPase